MTEQPLLPWVLSLETGESLRLCQCGQSVDGRCPPQCQRPQAIDYVAASQQTLLICRCGRSAQRPHCDGSHNRCRENSPMALAKSFFTEPVQALKKRLPNKRKKSP